MRVKNEDGKPSETQIAISFVEYVAKVHPDLLEDLIKIDNENKCSWAEGKLKKRMGKRKGASDYFIMKPTCKHIWAQSLGIVGTGSRGMFY